MSYSPPSLLYRWFTSQYRRFGPSYAKMLGKLLAYKGNIYLYIESAMVNDNCKRVRFVILGLVIMVCNATIILIPLRTFSRQYIMCNATGGKALPISCRLYREQTWLWCWLCTDSWRKGRSPWVCSKGSTNWWKILRQKTYVTLHIQIS